MPGSHGVRHVPLIGSSDDAPGRRARSVLGEPTSNSRGPRVVARRDADGLDDRIPALMGLTPQLSTPGLTGFDRIRLGKRGVGPAEKTGLPTTLHEAMPSLHNPALVPCPLCTLHSALCMLREGRNPSVKAPSHHTGSPPQSPHPHSHPHQCPQKASRRHLTGACPRAPRSPMTLPKNSPLLARW